MLCWCGRKHGTYYKSPIHTGKATWRSRQTSNINCVEQTHRQLCFKSTVWTDLLTPRYGYIASRQFNIYSCNSTTSMARRLKQNSKISYSSKATNYLTTTSSSGCATQYNKAMKYDDHKMKIIQSSHFGMMGLRPSYFDKRENYFSKALWAWGASCGWIMKADNIDFYCTWRTKQRDERKWKTARQ